MLVIQGTSTRNVNDSKQLLKDTNLPDSITPGHWQNILSPLNTEHIDNFFLFIVFQDPMMKNEPLFKYTYEVYLTMVQSILTVSKCDFMYCWFHPLNSELFFTENLPDFISKLYKKGDLEGSLILPAPVIIFSHVKIL